MGGCFICLFVQGYNSTGLKVEVRFGAMFCYCCSQHPYSNSEKIFWAWGEEFPVISILLLLGIPFYG